MECIWKGFRLESLIKPFKVRLVSFLLDFQQEGSVTTFVLFQHELLPVSENFSKSTVFFKHLDINKIIDWSSNKRNCMQLHMELTIHFSSREQWFPLKRLRNQKSIVCSRFSTDRNCKIHLARAFYKGMENY